MTICFGILKVTIEIFVFIKCTDEIERSESNKRYASSEVSYVYVTADEGMRERFLPLVFKICKKNRGDLTSDDTGLNYFKKIILFGACSC